MATRTSDNRPIWVDFIPDVALALPSGSLGMTFAPGMKDVGWNRDVITDMRYRREYWKTDVPVSRIEDPEYEFL